MNAGKCSILALMLLFSFCPLAWPAPVVAETKASVIDSDGDGLEDALESKLGTNPRSPDTDGDGLGDYDEYCKYRTDPTKADSDGDGKPDGKGEERREFTYTLKATCEVRPPDDAKLMSDLYQDARLLGPGRLKDSQIVELTIYPFATPHVYEQPFVAGQKVPKDLEQYIQPTLAMNYSPEMQRGVREIIKAAQTDVEAVNLILKWIARNTRLANREPEFRYFHVKDNQVVWHFPYGDENKNRELLETNFYGDSMFKGRVHGTCSSLASLRGTMLRAAGLPTRLIQTLPLINRYEGDPEPLAEKIRKREMANGYSWGDEGGGANHLYNEVYLSQHWIRVDDVVNRTPFVDDKLFITAWHAADYNNLFPPRPVEEGWNEKRELRTVSVEDALAKYPSKFDSMDLAIGNNDVRVERTPEGRYKLGVTIHHQGTIPSPSFRVNFYAGDPAQGGRIVSQNTAGPIMPGHTWSEGTDLLVLKEGEDRIHVRIDPDHKLTETSKSNNEAFTLIADRKARMDHR